MTQLPIVDPFYFDRRFQEFQRFVEAQGEPLRTFASNDYLINEEGYKEKIHLEAREKLRLQTWNEEMIGTGEITKAVVNAVEVKNNNLVTLDNRFGPKGQALYKLYTSGNEPSKITAFERAFYNLYFGDDEQTAIANLIKLFGKRYAIIAYLFFLKDRSEYMPIAPDIFDKAFNKLGIDFTTSRRCSWENYTAYNWLLKCIQLLLTEKLNSEVRLLDAHSFAYILAKQMEQGKDGLQAALEDRQITEYAELPLKDREAVIKARTGQGIFRKGVIDYFEQCAVTGCSNLQLLKASHMKPHKDCNPVQAYDRFNGLLLSPNIDALFDKGFITFSDEGTIVISSQLSPSDAMALGIENSIKISKSLDPKHLEYLQYHRDHIFRAD